MYAEFTQVCIHIYMYGRRVYLCECICLHICTPSLQVVYVFSCRQTEFACVCVHIYIYTHGNYMCVGAYSHICKPSLQMGVRRVYMYVCVYLHTCTKSTCVCAYIYIYAHVRTNACIHVCFCTCVYGYIYVCLYVRERTVWVHTDAVK